MSPFFQVGILKWLRALPEVSRFFWCGTQASCNWAFSNTDALVFFTLLVGFGVSAARSGAHELHRQLMIYANIMTAWSIFPRVFAAGLRHLLPMFSVHMNRSNAKVLYWAGTALIFDLSGLWPLFCYGVLVTPLIFVVSSGAIGFFGMQMDSATSDSSEDAPLLAHLSILVCIISALATTGAGYLAHASWRVQPRSAKSILSPQERLCSDLSKLKGR
jgi:hypothetical protein